jgi:hypothetical protein
VHIPGFIDGVYHWKAASFSLRLTWTSALMVQIWIAIAINVPWSSRKCQRSSHSKGALTSEQSSQ